MKTLLKLTLVVTLSLALAGCDSEPESKTPEVTDVIIVTGSDMAAPGVSVTWNPKTSVQVNEEFGLGIRVLTPYHDLAAYKITAKYSDGRVVTTREGQYYVPKGGQVQTVNYGNFAFPMAGRFTMEVYFMDVEGSQSNVFILTFDVIKEPVVLTPFEAAVLEVYEITGKTLFYSYDGVNPVGDADGTPVYNRVSGPNEMPGICGDYAIEFAYYWNEVKNYDEAFGKAYRARAGDSGFGIYDFIFVPDATVITDKEWWDTGIYRDMIFTSRLYEGALINHFGTKITGHGWVVIKYQGEWYDTEPTWWDTNPNTGDNDYVPYKLSFE